MKFVKKFILSLVLLSGISLGASSAKAGCSVHLGDFDWDSANIHTAIASFMIENGYGCDVEVTKGSTTPIMAAFFDNQIDIVTEVWEDNLVELLNVFSFSDPVPKLHPTISQTPRGSLAPPARRGSARDVVLIKTY